MFAFDRLTSPIPNLNYMTKFAIVPRRGILMSHNLEKLVIVVNGISYDVKANVEAPVLGGNREGAGRER
jgi:hypothetical protein